MVAGTLRGFRAFQTFLAGHQNYRRKKDLTYCKYYNICLIFSTFCCIIKRELKKGSYSAQAFDFIGNLYMEEAMNSEHIFSPEELQKAEGILSNLLAKYPLLHPAGWATHSYYVYPGFSERDVVAEREAMPKQHAGQFLKACLWIKENMEPSARFCKDISSYGLKHIAEEEIGYIMNGTFIAAAIHCGVDFAPIDKSPDPQNLYFKFNAGPFVKKYSKYF